MGKRTMTGIMVALAVVAAAGAEPATAQVDVDVGVVLRLPVGHVWIDVGPDRYAYYDGAYYRPHRNGRGWVRATLPIGAALLRLPPYARHRYVPGYGDYYVDRGCWYRPTYRDGVLVFIVLGPEPPFVARQPTYRYRSVRPPVRVYRPRPAPVRRAPPARRPMRSVPRRVRPPVRATPPRQRPRPGSRPVQRPPRHGSRPPPG